MSSTTPPEQQQPTGSFGGYGRPGPNIGAIMPIPGNAEIVVYVIAAVILAIVAAAADDFDANGWAVAFTWITAAYLISRGIAKASRVLER
jgi:YD repeat-containing protein